jgi:hypothetical protein
MDNISVWSGFKLCPYEDSATPNQSIPSTAVVELSGGQSPEIKEHTAPNRASTFPDDAAGRKARPVASGVLDYFPDAVVAIAEVSFIGNEQHNPGKPLHWDRSKSQDEADALMRHFLQRGELDTDGVRHSAKMAWRSLALLQKEIEEDMKRAKESESNRPEVR